MTLLEKKLKTLSVSERRRLARSLKLKLSTVSGWARRGVPVSRREKVEFFLRPVPSELLESIEIAGSKAALARRLGLSPSTVQRWGRKKTLPEGRLEQLESFIKKEREARYDKEYQQAEDWNEFQEYMHQAGEMGILERGVTSEGVRGGAKTVGYRWTKGVNLKLNERTIRSILDWVRTLPRRYKLWQAAVVASFFSTVRDPEEPPGKWYKTVYSADLDGDRKGDFAVESTLTTHRVGQKDKLYAELKRKLDEVLGDYSILTFIHEVTIYNYRPRTKEELKEWNRAHKAKYNKSKKQSSKRAGPDTKKRANQKTSLTKSSRRASRGKKRPKKSSR